MVCDPKHPHSQWAKLDAKAGETKHFAPCFLQVAKKMWDKSKRPVDHRMIKALEGMTSFVRLCDRNTMFFLLKNMKKLGALQKALPRIMKFWLLGQALREGFFSTQ